MKLLRLLVISLALVMAACSKEMIMQETPGAKGGIPFSATLAAAGGGAGTKTTYTEEEGYIHVVWKTGDKIALVHKGIKDIVTVTAVSSSGEASVEGEITGTPSDNEEVALVFPADAVGVCTGGTGFSTNAEFLEKVKNQGGTLEYIQDNIDFRSGTGRLVLDEGKASLKASVSLLSRLAIWKLTLQDESSEPLAATTVTVSWDEMQAEATGTTAGSTYYIGLINPPADSGNFDITATAGAEDYYFFKAGTLTLKEGKYYQSPVTMMKVQRIPLSMKALTTGTIVVNNPPAGMQYSKNGGEKVTMGGALETIEVSVGDRVQFYGKGTSVMEYGDGTRISGGTAEVNLYGNIMSLLDEEGYPSATALTHDWVFRYLFRDNTKLKDAGGLLLPAATLTSGCYQEMFAGCTSLTASPALPAATLTSGCYQEMFAGCTSLTASPVLPAATLAASCYASMFYGCSSLSEVFCWATDISATDCTANWLEDVSAAGTFTAPGTTAWTENSASGIPAGWTRVSPAPLTMEALTAGTIVVNNPPPGMQYSKNGGDKVTMGGSGEAIEVSVGDRVQFYGKGTSIMEYGNTAGTRISGGTAEVNLYGNIMSLLDEEGYPSATALPRGKVFFALFRGNTKLKDAGGLLLPATTLAASCYQEMFWGCTSLETAPDLPATTLAASCYNSMFSGCDSLTAAPALPATTLAASCYNSMFSGCDSLTAAPALPATTLEESCYRSMFYNCTSLETAPDLPATTLAASCYNGMFRGCTSLETAPDLPATTLAASCYQEMFWGCTSLETAPDLPATTLAASCYANMFRGCTSLETAPDLPATTLEESCYYTMFAGCTSLETAPDLPATTLAVSCYYGMFSGCTALTAAPALPATTLVSNCYYGMFHKCSSLETAPDLPATTLAASCYSLMFNECSSLSKVVCLATDISASGCTNNWLYGVAASGTFTTPGTTAWRENSTSGIPAGWTRTEP